MRTRFSVAIAVLFGVVLSGCGAPEAEFAWNERTQDLLPPARTAVQEAVVNHFGTPAKMIGWQRLPIDFGGALGVVTDAILDDENGLVTELAINFEAPALLVKYDRNLDGLLTVDELPTELEKLLSEKAGSKTLLERADADANGILMPAELQTIASRLPEEWGKLIGETASPLNAETASEYVGTELLFATGNYSKQKVEVTEIVDAKKGTVKIWPPLAEAPANQGAPVQVVLDFGQTMRSGRKHYMHHCMHCHGVTGDGNGPTAKYLNPLPRDYRQGIFKFASTMRNDRPQRDDLDRILRHGIPGTYMPSFAMLKDSEVSDIIEYVRWLAMRGEYENELVTLLEESFSKKKVDERIEQELLSYQGAVKQGREVEKVTPQTVRAEVEEELTEALKTFPEEVDLAGDELAEDWRKSQQTAAVVYPKVPRTPDSPESRGRGRFLFLGKCAVCHGTTGEGDGPQTKDYGEDPITKERYKEPGLFDSWGHSIQPRNLTQGIYRGGRRPLDIYRRVHQGIPGTPMAPFSTFSDEEIWDIVNYVLSIPYDGPMEQFNGRRIARTQPEAKALKPSANNVAQAEESSDGK